jgi:hypothetical protein
MASIQDIKSKLTKLNSYEQSLASQMIGYPDFREFTASKNMVGKGQSGKCYKVQKKNPDGSIMNACLKHYTILDGCHPMELEEVKDELLLLEYA